MIVQFAKFKNELKVVCIYAVVLVIELWWHWYLSYEHPAAKTLMGMYLYQGHWSAEGYLDLVLPGAVAGAALGRIGWEWSRRKLFAFTLFLGAGLVAVTPLYAHLLQRNVLWWWPKTNDEIVRYLAFQLPKAWAIVGFLAYFGYVFGAHAHAKSGDKSGQSGSSPVSE